MPVQPDFADNSTQKYGRVVIDLKLKVKKFSASFILKDANFFKVSTTIRKFGRPWINL